MNFYHETEYNYSKVERLANMLYDLANAQASHPGAVNQDIITDIYRARRFASTGAGWAFASTAISELIVKYCIHADTKDFPYRIKLLSRLDYVCGKSII